MSAYTLLRRNLLYTAITLAKRLVVLVGSRNVLAIAVRTAGTGRRHQRNVRRANQRVDRREREPDHREREHHRQSDPCPPITSATTTTSPSSVTISQSRPDTSPGV
jgi:hypothetical protein